jgi:Ulp1 family protease
MLKTISVHFFRPYILIFDSIKDHFESHSKVATALREYFSSEFQEKFGDVKIIDETTMPSESPRVPRQPNKTDCGLFLIQYMESFFMVRSFLLKQWKPLNGITLGQRQIDSNN